MQLQIKTISSISRKSDHGSHGPNTTTHHTRPIPLIDDYNSYYNDPGYGFDPYWEIHTYKQRHLFFNTYFDKPDVDIEPDSSQTEQALKQTLTNALVDPWQTNDTLPHLPNQHKQADVIPNSGPQVSLTTAVEARYVNTLMTRMVELDYVPLTTNLGLKYKRRMLYFPMDFDELTLDGLVDTGALSSAIPETDLRKIQLLAPQSIIKEGPAPNFQIMVPIGQLENPKSTVELKFEVSDIVCHEMFIVMQKPTSPSIGLSFLQRNNTILDMRQRVLNFPFFDTIKDSGSQVYQCHGAYRYKRGYHTSPKCQTIDLHKFPNVCRHYGHSHTSAEHYPY